MTATSSWLGFVIVACIWGITNPWIKHGSAVLQQRNISSTDKGQTWIMRFISDWRLLLQTPAYTLPLLINLIGSILYYVTLNNSGIFC